MRHPLLLCVVLLLSGCGGDGKALDQAARDACQEGFVAGAAELAGEPDVEALHLLNAYTKALRSHTTLMSDWRRSNAALGTSTRKTTQDADEAVRVLLNVCHALAFVPVPPTPSAWP
jgi:hypothetical protein